MFDLIRINKDNKTILENLLEYYLYDFNFYYEDDLKENGRFEFIDVEPYINSENKAYLITNNDKLAGFILIKKTENINIIEEFWIMPKYRKGMFAFKVLKQVFSELHGEVEFIILNKNKRWLEVIKYWINKNYEIIKTEKIIKWHTEEFTKFTIYCK